MLTKFAKSYLKSNAHQGDMTQRHLKNNLTADLMDAEILQTLTKKQLTAVINIANRSYHDGRNTGASIEGDCVWIGGNAQKLIPLTVIKKINVERKLVGTTRAINVCGTSWPAMNIYTDRYTLDYSEEV